LFPGPASESTFEPLEGLDDAEAIESAVAANASQDSATPATAWFYSAGDQQFGPTPATEIRQLFAAGELNPNDMVWREGMDTWVAIRDVPELRPRSTFNAGSTGVGQDGVPTTSGMAITSLVLGVVSLVI